MPTVWDMLTEQTRAELTAWQQREYVYELEMHHRQREEEILIESPEEIETLMQTPPTRSRGLY